MSTTDEEQRPAAELAEAGQTPVAVAVNGQLRLLPGVATRCALTARTASGGFTDWGLETVLAMGDTWEPAATTARAAGIGTVRAGLLPQDKTAPITQLRRERGPVAMVGDGIGAVADAVMLARATRTIIRQNLGSAFGYNLIPVPLAAAGVLPSVLAAAMAASSVTVVGNALRLRRFGKTGPGRRPTTAA